MERLSRQFSHGTAMLVEENRRAADEAGAAFREESRRRQQQYLTDLSSLNREVRVGEGSWLQECNRNEWGAIGGSRNTRPT